MALELVKSNVGLAAGAERTVLMENQGSTVYDIWMVKWTMSLTDPLATNEQVLASLSLRGVDQVEDAVAVPFPLQLADPSIFATFGYSADLITEGGIALIPSLIIPYNPKPFTVPFLAKVTNSAVASPANVGVEVYFERRRVSASEKVSIVAQTGGRIRSG